jgi:nicotinamidase-related amidase
VIAVAAVVLAVTGGAPPQQAGPAGPLTLRQLYGLAAPRALQARRTALLLVDFQEEFFSGRLRLPEGPRAVERAARLVAWARGAGIRVVHVRNVVSRPGSPVFAEGSPTTALVAALTPHREDLVLTKGMAGAFSRTDLDARLRTLSIDTLIVGGLMTHLAVAITASDATVLGYRTIVAADATATRPLVDVTVPARPGSKEGVPAPVLDAQLVQRVALAALADRAADVLTTEAVMRIPVRAE